MNKFVIEYDIFGNVTYYSIDQVNVEYLSKKINELDLQQLITLKVFLLHSMVYALLWITARYKCR